MVTRFLPVPKLVYILEENATRRGLFRVFLVPHVSKSTLLLTFVVVLIVFVLMVAAEKIILLFFRYY